MHYKLVSYLIFLWKSTNQHGIHSPFVFDFVTKGLYSKLKINDLEKKSFSENLNKKEKKILFKIFSYFSNHIVYSDVKIMDAKTKSIFYFTSSKDIEIGIPKNNDSFLIIKGIHQNKEAFISWNKLIEIDFTTLTIDLYYFGLIFFRKEQVKEHFIIRI